MSDQWGGHGEERGEPASHGRGRRQRIVVAAIVAGLLGGAAVGLTLGVPGVAHGQSAQSTTSTTKPSATAKRSDYLNSALAPLVKNGTITQAQADAVVKTLEDAGKARLGQFAKVRGIGDVFSAAAKKIGVSEDALRTALRNGQSIADVAKSKHVDPNAVVDAMVAATKTNLDQAVKNGKFSASVEQAQLTKIKTMYTAVVNGKAGKMFGFGFGHHFKGRKAPNSSTPNGSVTPNGANARFSAAPIGNTI